MYRFIVLLMLISSCVPVYASRTVTTHTPIYNPYYGAYYGGDYVPNRRIYPRRYNSRFSDINELEKYAMNKNFTRDSDIIRLERLENMAFGAVQTGDIDTRYENVRDAILSRPKQNYKTSLIRGIADYFSGQLTGYTPVINQNSNYYDDTSFGRSSATNYATPFGSGYRINNYGTGSGMGVHILD